jgi:hypothetical protein
MNLPRLLPLLILLGFVGAAPWEGESVQQWTTDSQVRILINSPAVVDETKPTELMVYATPNGNTIEQTLGCQMAAGMDWHYDIQHVAAQVRKLRQIDQTQNIVLACVEAQGLRWPAWRTARPDNGTLIRGIVAQVAGKITPAPRRIALTGHSGGGSFIIGYLNGGDAVPPEVERIVFLDANYAYSDADKHGDKLLAWLKSSPASHLVVLAYDDRDVMYNGKKIVSATGGTYSSSHRMIDRLKKDVEVKERAEGPFERFSAMNGQIEFAIHTNPEKKILHTRLVELNGLLHAMTLGTPQQKGWGEFWGDRAYSELIQPAAKVATTGAATQRAVVSIPARPSDALGGKAFMTMLAALPADQRQAAIVKEITRGNVPAFLREFKTLRVSGAGLDGRTHVGEIQVMPDYLAVGSDEDFCRVPMTPMSADQIANAFGCTRTTRKMADDIYAAAEVKLEPKPLTEKREAIETFVQHNSIIEDQRAGKKLGLLVAGIKKDVVITPKSKEKPGKVAIYGWHKLEGKAIQPLYLGHVDWYVDYSHGIRLLKGVMVVEDGVERNVADVLKDAELCSMLSDEGPM